MSKPRIRTLIIDDSAFMRKVISDIINKDSEIDLVGIAANGKEGTDMALELKPDVVVTDMMMPEYDGMYVVRSVMEQRPVPIILLSSLEKTNSVIFDALQHGAFEFIDKLTILDKVSKEYNLLNLIKEASRADVNLLKARQLTRKRKIDSVVGKKKLTYKIIAIGASTGGPGALETIVTNFPEKFTIPVVIAQHMPHRFLETFTQRLNERSNLTVKLAERGEVLAEGTVYIAPGESNMYICEDGNGYPSVAFSRKKFAEFNNPSVDCLFESVASIYGSRSIGIILSGMGKDGAKGLLSIKKNGGYTIAQDELSSVVYGMPKAAVENGGVKQVLSLNEIPTFISSSV
jgi:two-component system chemotaxis response regulator CheB